MTAGGGAAGVRGAVVGVGLGVVGLGAGAGSLTSGPQAASNAKLTNTTRREARAIMDTSVLILI